ncbi:MAG: hypothetical protein L3K14_04440 [Thermoplasmata archaeon]|nr:hypothetical protein [Thermoplasmata archaeon]
MTDAIWLLRALEGLVLVLGAGIAYASLRAYARTGRTSLGLLGLGFVLVTVAAALAGILYEFVTHDLLTAWSVSAAFDGAGFAVILYSILRRSTEPPAEPPADLGTPPPGT